MSQDADLVAGKRAPPVPPPRGERTLISREPWWYRPPAPGQDEMTLTWVYVEFWSDGTTCIGQGTPTPDEIRNRKSCRLSHLPD